MKTNTPEKLWINPATDLPKLSGPLDKDSIKYVRTDVFIEKATEWLKKNVTYTHPRKGTEECVVNLNAFIEAMKGE